MVGTRVGAGSSWTAPAVVSQALAAGLRACWYGPRRQLDWGGSCSGAILWYGDVSRRERVVSSSGRGAGWVETGVIAVLSGSAQEEARANVWAIRAVESGAPTTNGGPGAESGSVRQGVGGEDVNGRTSTTTTPCQPVSSSNSKQTQEREGARLMRVSSSQSNAARLHARTHAAACTSHGSLQVHRASFDLATAARQQAPAIPLAEICSAFVVICCYTFVPLPVCSSPSLRLYGQTPSRCGPPAALLGLPFRGGPSIYHQLQLQLLANNDGGRNDSSSSNDSGPRQ